jgi:SpoVK/Ycf46/Vps4 family AAA+-type ATPase
MLFLNPIKAREQKPVDIDPDAPLVDESRSALLFGPPGTGKTSLVKGLASALNWDYVEVLASDFLSEGMDQVPKAADAIFKKLMELDHCVILFDEIDELIRARDGVSSDPFGRFLTTSMLPKLAKLWDQRRVLFFVNTNDIAVADPAIKRSQRFDAAMFVPPPSFQKKKKRLDELLPFKVRLRRKDVEKALTDQKLSRGSLGVFALLRWDQIDDLAHRILRATTSGVKVNQALLDALDNLGEELERTDWKRSVGSAANAGSENLEGAIQEDRSQEQMFQRWRNQHLDERRDFRNSAVLRVSRSLRLPKGWEQYSASASDARYVLLDSSVEDALEMSSSGILRLKGSRWVAVDPSGTLSFEEG